LCDAKIGLCIIHKVRQITIISYTPVIQIKLYVFRQRNDRKNSAISTFEKQIKQSNMYCKSTV